MRAFFEGRQAIYEGRNKKQIKIFKIIIIVFLGTRDPETSSGSLKRKTNYYNTFQTQLDEAFARIFQLLAFLVQYKHQFAHY